MNEELQAGEVRVLQNICGICSASVSQAMIQSVEDVKNLRDWMPDHLKWHDSMLETANTKGGSDE